MRPLLFALLSSCLDLSALERRSTKDAAQDVAQLEAGAPCPMDLSRDAKNCGRCGHDCLGGACTMGQCAPVALVLGEADADNLAEDASTLFWTRRGATAQLSELRSMPKPTGAPLTLTSGAAADAVASGGPFVYIVRRESAGPTLYAAPKAGGAEQKIASHPSFVIALVADDTAAYWVEPDPQNLTFQGYRVLHGGTAQRWGPLYLDIASARLDDTYLFGHNGVSVVRLPKDGSLGPVDVISFSSLTIAAIAVTSDEVLYYREDLGTIRATSKRGVGGKGDRLVAGAVKLTSSVDNRALATHGSWVAWADDTTGLWICDLTTCETTRTHLASQGLITSVLIEDDRVYFTDRQAAGLYAVALP